MLIAGRARRQFIWVGVLCVLVIGLIVQIGRRPRTQSADEFGLGGHRQAVSYAGTQACVPCHRTIAEQFQRSGMGRSWRTIESQAQPQFGESEPSHHPLSNLSYRTFQLDGRYYVQESRLETALNPEHQLTREIHFTIGSGKHAQAYVTMLGGYLTLAPTNWFALTGRWDFNPGYDRHNWRFDRPVPAECVGCHNGQGVRLAGSVNRYQLPLADGIGCEQCHGPGERHVAERRRATDGSLHTTTADPSIVNPDRLEAAQQNDVCFQCHLSADVRWSRRPGADENFLPGLRLADFRADFFAEPEDPNAVGVASHGARMVQSRCYTKSNGRLTCILCHDPHVPANEVARSVYDSKCVGCHIPQTCPTSNAQRPTGQSCVGCHMPTVPASNAPHVVFTEHWIRAVPPSAPLTSATSAKAKRSPGQPVRLTNFWSKETPVIDEGIAYIAYYDEHTEDRVIADLLHGMHRLTGAPRRGMSLTAEAEYWLGIGYGHQGQWEPAIAALEAAARRLTDPNLLAAAYARLGAACQQSGKRREAVEAYEYLMKRFPDNLESYDGLVPLAIAQEQLDRAIELCEKSLGHYRNQPTLLAHLAFAQVQNSRSPRSSHRPVRRGSPGPDDEARSEDGAQGTAQKGTTRERVLQQSLALLDEAQRLDPDLALVYFTRAAVQELAGDGSTARKAYRDAFCALARGSLVTGDRSAAQQFLDQALQATPGDAAVIQWRRDLAGR